MDERSAPITALLHRWRAGDEAAADELLPLVYAQLREIARRRLQANPVAQTLVPTELVHEAYLKLTGAPPSSTDRQHFFAIASRAMRQVLVGHERHRRADKRREGERVTLSSLKADDANLSIDLLAFDQALDGLERIDARKARIIELSAFGGLEFDEIAEAVGISRATLARDLRAARAWLYHALALPRRPASA
jgi:RNA polymerase sigma factor (TIGR02999 family)